MHFLTAFIRCPKLLMWLCDIWTTLKNNKNINDNYTTHSYFRCFSFRVVEWSELLSWSHRTINSNLLSFRLSIHTIVDRTTSCRAVTSNNNNNNNNIMRLIDVWWACAYFLCHKKRTPEIKAKATQYIHSHEYETRESTWILFDHIMM